MRLNCLLQERTLMEKVLLGSRGFCCKASHQQLSVAMTTKLEEESTAEKSKSL